MTKENLNQPGLRGPSTGPIDQPPAGIEIPAVGRLPATRKSAGMPATRDVTKPSQ